MTKKKRRYENVSHFTDRHGKLRWRWRKAGFPTYYFRNPPDTPGFKEELAAIEAGGPIRAGAERAIPGSVNDLVARFYDSPDFANRGGADDKRRRRLLLESFRADFGNDLVRHFTFAHIERILLKRAQKRVDERGRTVGGEVAATSLRKQLRRLFAYAKRLQWIPTNPVEDAERVGKTKLEGYHTWTEAEIAQFQRRHPLGTKARLALEIMLWTGQRRGDARLFGPKHVINGRLNFKTSKNSADLWQPLAPQLREAIDAMQSVGLHTFLVTDFGKPFSRAGFGNKMREWCDQADLPQCSAHGLRKGLGRRLAEDGATNQQIKAVGGWKGDQEVATYTAAAEQERLANTALTSLASAHLANRGGGLAKSETQATDKEQ